MKKLLLSLACLASFLFATIDIAMAQPPVNVGVYAEHYGGKLVYHYRVVNNGPDNIAAVWIGYDSKNDNNNYNDVMELVELPSGWNFNSGIPPGSVTSPPGWHAYVITPEGMPGNVIAWEVIDNNSPRLVSGQTFTGMSITLDKADANYVTSHADIHFSNKRQYPTTLTVPLERLDTTPPILSVTLTPTKLWPPNGKLVPITATISVKDDYDPAPEIKLESITPSELSAPDDIQDATLGTDDRQFMLKATRDGNNKAGRVYTVIYSATDASGNQSIATATVTVPHDQGG